jgi:hypothetical protein
MPYLTAHQIEAKMADLELRFPGICNRFPLSNSVLNNPIHGLRIQGGPHIDYRPKVLITAGVHAREWAPPDALLSFIEELLVAYDKKTDITEKGFNYTNRRNLHGLPGSLMPTLTYGTYVVTARNVQNIVDKLETYFIPMVNPDGRDFSLAVEAFWRKNRASFREWQLIKVINATGGTFTLTFQGATTGPIAFDASSTAMQQALSQLKTVGAGNVEVAKPADYTCFFVRFTGGIRPSRMTYDITKLTGGLNLQIVVNWGDGVDINRNFDIGFAKEIYYSPAGAVEASGSANLDEPGTPNKFDVFRGPKAMSEVETTNVSTTMLGKDYFLDLHLFDTKILLPWDLESLQSKDSSQWFGNPAWDRRRDWKSGGAYKEWFPADLGTKHEELGKAMAGEIMRAADANGTESDYDVVEAADGLYAATGTAQDYAVSRQFLRDNAAGDNKFAITFEAGSKLDGGYFPTQNTGQYQKVERDIHGGIVGLLLRIVQWAAAGPPPTPTPIQH